MVNTGEMFEIKIKELFIVLGFSVERDVLIAGTQIDLVIEKKTGPFTDKFIVECKDHANNIPIGMIKEFQSTIEAVKKFLPGIKGIFVSRHSLTKEAKSFADSLGIQHTSIFELEKKVLNCEPYIHSLIDTFDSSDLSSHYILLDGFKKNKQKSKNRALDIDGTPKAAKKTGFKDTVLIDNKSDILLNELLLLLTDYERKPLEEIVNDWLSNDNSRCLFLLGDYGAGKTSFVQYYSVRQSREYIADNTFVRCPIIINLRDYPNGVTKQTIVSDVAQKLNCSYLDWNSLYKYFTGGYVLLLFDGFDEMGFQIDERIRKAHIGSVLELLSIPNLKMIVTGRPNYFPTSNELLEIIDLIRLSVSSSQDHDFVDIIKVAPLTSMQIEQYIDSYEERWGKEKTLEIKNIVGNIYGFQDLASRPFLLDLIVKTMPEIERIPDKKKITPATLYEIYTNRWIDRENQKGAFRWLIGRDQKNTFMKSVAWEMLKRGSLQLHYSDLNECVRKHFMLNSPELTDYFAHDIRTCSFLTRDDNSNYYFAHKSFMEYFAALKIVDEVRKVDKDNKSTAELFEPDLTDNIISFAIELCGFDLLRSASFINVVLDMSSYYSLMKSLNRLSLSARNILWPIVRSIDEYKDISKEIEKAFDSTSWVLPLYSSNIASEHLDKDTSSYKVKKVIICSFCKLTQYDVKKLVAGQDVYICEQCIKRTHIYGIANLLGARSVDNQTVKTSSDFLLQNVDTKCSFCYKNNEDIEYMVSNIDNNIFICNECLTLCDEILVEDLEKQENA